MYILKNREKGITMIALAVTIIVLMILAGVSINMIVGDNGIIIQAQNAKEETEKADMKEKIEMDILEKELESTGNISKGDFVDILSQYFNDVPTEKNLPEDLNDLTLTSKEEYGGYELNIGEIWNGTFVKTVADIEEGAYIKYNSGTNGEILCRVLYGGDSQYGVQIISDKNVGTVNFNATTLEEGKTNYNNVIEALNSAAEAYINQTYAEDARCVGSMPTIENGVFVDKNSEATAPFTMQFEYNGSTSIDCKRADNNYVTDQAKMQNLGMWITGEDYWLASRYVNSTSSYCSFGVRYGDTSGTMGTHYLCNVFSDGSTNGYPRAFGLRPCILLKANIKVVGGDGASADTAYEL